MPRVRSAPTSCPGNRKSRHQKCSEAFVVVTFGLVLDRVPLSPLRRQGVWLL